jgi:hypothetical protein
MGKRINSKIITVILILSLSVLAFAGCGNKGIEGTWVLVEEYEADGTKITGKELEDVGVSETYEIKDGTVTYTLEMSSAKKPVVMEFELEDLGNNTYNIRIPNSSVIFASPVLNGNTFSYYVGEDENAMKMVFRRK